MRALLVKFAGLALYIHELQSSTLVLTHERPDKDPRVHKVYEEDLEDTADELDAAAFGSLQPGLEASAQGLSLRLIKNDGVLKVAYEGKHGEIVHWEFQGLSSMMASASTQTVSEAPPQLSNSTIQTLIINPFSQHLIWPLRSELSGISTIETRPIKSSIKAKEGVPAQATVVARENELKRQMTKYTSHPAPHDLARTKHDSRPWPNHFFMACYHLRPRSQSDVGVLHIDLVKGTVWYEAWHGRAHVSQQTYTRKQVDLRNASTSVGYLSHGARFGEDFSTHQLRLSKLTTKKERVTFFSADCSAPGYRVWGSDSYKSLGPIPHYSALAWNESRQASGTPISIPRLPAETTKRYTSPTIIINALVHCIDRASGRQAIHNPLLDRNLRQTIFEGFLDMARTCSDDEWMVKWIAAIQEAKKRKALRKTMRVVEIASEQKLSIKKPKTMGSKDATVTKRSGEPLVAEEKEANKAKVDTRTADGTVEDVVLK